MRWTCLSFLYKVWTLPKIMDSSVSWEFTGQSHLLKKNTAKEETVIWMQTLGLTHLPQLKSL